MKRALSALALMALLPACGGNPAADTPTPAEEGTAAAAMAAATIKGNEGRGMGTDAFASETGCYWISGIGREIACVQHTLEMGFMRSEMKFFDMKDPVKPTNSFVIFDGNNGSDEGVNAAGVAATNALFAKGKFKAAGAYARGEGLNEAVKEMLPPTPPQSPECCEMKPAATTTFKKKGWLAVAYEISCKFAPGPGAGVCYVKDYNDESHPTDVAFRFKRL